MDIFQAYLDQVMSLLSNHPFLQVGTIVVVSFLVAKFVGKKIPNALTKLAEKFNSPVGAELAGMTSTPLFFFIFLSGIGIAVKFLPYGETAQFIFSSTLKSIFIVIFAAFILRVVKLLLVLASKKEDSFDAVMPTTLPLFENIGVLLISVGAVHQIFTAWNVNMTALLASAGIVGLALGMAAKDTLSDVFSGVLILTDGPYQIGEFIEVDQNTRGTVTQIGIRNTKILTRDNVSIVVPNATMGNAKIYNRSAGPEGKYRVRIPVFLPYGTDLKLVMSTLDNIGKTCSSAVLEDPPAKTIVTRLGESRLELLLLCWVADPHKRMSVLNAANIAIYEQFGQDKIPFASDSLDINLTDAITTQHDLFVKEAPVGQQEVVIKESPVGRQVVHVKDMPDLFGRKD